MLFDSRENDEDDERICRALWDLYDKADVIVAHNGNAFDQKTMRARWVQYGMMPPSPYKEVDTLRSAKMSFRFPSNKLDAIARYLHIGCKKEHEGFTLWTRCMAGERDAWQIMEEYNINDVRILERVYLRLRAWDRQHPNVSLYYEDGAIRCVTCGSRDVVDIPQDTYTSVSSFPSCRCTKCGKTMRSGVRNKQWKEDLKRHSL